MVRRTMLVLVAVAFALCAAPALAEDPKPGTHEGKVVKVEGTKLTMSDKDNKTHTHAIPADAKVMVNGKEGKLTDLKAGDKIKVTVEKKGEQFIVTKVEKEAD